MEFLEYKIGLPGCKGIEEMKKLEIKKLSSERKVDRIMDRLNISLNKHKYIKKAIETFL